MATQKQPSKYIGKVPVDKLTVDHRVQREALNTAKLNGMIADPDWDALGVIIVSKRNNGTFIALDGWHRTELCKLAEGAPTELDAIIHEGLDLAAEARLFRLYNNRTSLRATDVFRSENQEGLEEAVLVTAAIAEYGMTVGRGSFNAVAQARKIVRRRGIEMFQQVLAVIDKAFVLDSYSADYRMLAGICEMLHHYPQMDVDGFVKRLSEVGLGDTPEERNRGGVATIIRNAKAYHDATHPGSFDISMCTVLVPIYNKGRKDAGRLPSYERRNRGAKVGKAVEA